MSSQPVSLADVQQWMLDAVTQLPNGDPSASADTNAELVLPSRQQSAAERLAVYQRAYYARLLEVLGEQFPATRYAVGDDVFAELAMGYIRACPPRGYTLAALGDRFAEHLNATRPADWGAFVVELARLEQAIDRVFDGPGPESDAEASCAAVRGNHARLVSGFELHGFTYPVSTYFTVWKAGENPAWPAAAPQWVCLFRRDYIVRRHELTHVQYELLRCLQETRSLDNAVTAAATAAGVTDATSLDALAADIRRWFEGWSQAGIFVAQTAR